jgi:hypothetical protein
VSCGWEDLLRDVLSDPATSYWLKRSLSDSIQNRDPLDALRDAETMVEILRGRLDHMLREQLGPSIFRPPYDEEDDCLPLP